jgi:hypothetical protein
VPLDTPVTGIDVTTDNGEIEIQVANPQDIEARTVNGPTNIGVENDPAGRYYLDLRTRNGAISVATTCLQGADQCR